MYKTRLYESKITVYKLHVLPLGGASSPFPMSSYKVTVQFFFSRIYCVQPEFLFIIVTIPSVRIRYSIALLDIFNHFGDTKYFIYYRRFWLAD